MQKFKQPESHPYMKKRLSFAFLCLLPVVPVFGAASLIQNGNFEIGSVGSPPPFWTLSGDKAAVAVSGSFVSPFVNVYPPGAALFLFGLTGLWIVRRSR